MFEPYLNLDKIYFSPLKPAANGLCEVMTRDEVCQAIELNTESRLMNELKLLLACSNNFEAGVVSEKLGVGERDLKACVRVLFGCSLKSLLAQYRRRRLMDLTSLTTLPPEEVARLTGFASAQSLCNHFNRIEKCTFFAVRGRSQVKRVNKFFEARKR